MEPRWRNPLAAVAVSVLLLAALMLLQKWAPAKPSAMSLSAASVSRPVTVTLLATQNITSDGQTSVVGVGYYREAIGYITTTVASGSITYTWQTSPDQVGWWTYYEAMVVASSGGVTLPFSVAFGPFVRVSYDVSTGGSVTPSIVLALKE